MGRRRANLVIADPLLKPYYIRFDGHDYNIYKTGQREKIDTSVNPNKVWYEPKEVFVSREKKLAECIDAIVHDRIIEQNKSEGIPDGQTQILTLKSFTSAMNSMKEEVAAALNMEVVYKSND